MTSFFFRTLSFFFRGPTSRFSEQKNSIYINNPKNIVVTRLQDVGDMLVFIPFLKSLRNAYPGSHIALITRNKLGHETIYGCPYVNEIIQAGSGLASGFFFYKKLRSLKPDLFLFSTQEFGKIKWALWAGAKIIVGYPKPKVFNKVKKVPLYEYLTIAPPFDNNKDEIENNLDLLRAIGISKVTRAMEYSWINTIDIKSVENLLVLKGVAKKDLIMVFSPATKQNTKRWESRKFAELADRVIETLGVKIVFSGGPDDEGLVYEITGLMKERAVSLAGKTTLKQLPALLKRAYIVVTVDSGPMHFAAAVKTPYVAIFGPGEYHKWAHQDQPDTWRNIYHEKECAPCDRQECLTMECIKEVSVDNVFNEVQKLMVLIKT